MRRRLDTGGDEGASLIFALIFVMFVSVLSLSTLAFIESSFSVSSEFRENRSDNYTAEAALDVAVQQVVSDVDGSLGAPGETCEFTVAGVNGKDGLVSCEPINGAGGTDPSKLKYAVLALSATSPLQIAGNKPLVVAGNVHTNAGVVTGEPFGTLTLTPGGFSSTGVLTSPADECPGAKIVALPKSCAAASVAAPSVPSPLTSAVQASYPPPNPAPICQKRGPVWVAQFTPAQFTISPSAPHFMDVGDCQKAQVLYFPAGVYGLDNSIDLRTENLSTAQSNDFYDLVAGTAGGWLGTSAVPKAEGACQPNAAGTSFAFSTGSRLTVTNHDANVHLCSGPKSAGATPPVIFGGSSFSADRKASLFINGPVHMPGGAVDLALHGNSELYFRGGLVANTIRLDWSPSNPQVGAPIEAEIGCTGLCRTNRHVEFIARIGTENWIRAVVKFNDAGGMDPTHPHTVESWTVLPAGWTKPAPMP